MEWDVLNIHGLQNAENCSANTFILRFLVPQCLSTLQTVSHILVKISYDLKPFSVKLQLSDFWGQLYNLNEFDGILDKVDADMDLHITNIRYIS